LGVGASGVALDGGGFAGGSGAAGGHDVG
jgi:hypothetical protein